MEKPKFLVLTAKRGQGVQKLPALSRSKNRETKILPVGKLTAMETASEATKKFAISQGKAIFRKRLWGRNAQGFY